MPEQAPISFNPYLETSSNPSLPGNCTEGDLLDVGCDLCDIISAISIIWVTFLTFPYSGSHLPPNAPCEYTVLRTWRPCDACLQACSQATVLCDPMP